MKKKLKKSTGIFLMLVCVVCVFSLFIKNTVQAETAGSGARIILYDEPELAKFHIGRVVGSSVQLAAEATTETELTDIVFTSSDTGVCSVEEEDEYWEVTCLKEGTAIIHMTCKVDEKVVKRDLLMSSMTELGSMDDPVYGIVKEGTTVYYGCSDQEGITSKSTEIKTVLTEDIPVIVTYACNDFYRVELVDGSFGETLEYWGYVKKSQVIIPVSEVTMPEELTYFDGESDRLDVSVIPENATDQRLRFVSSNTNVVTVDADGNFRAAGVGTAVITAVSLQDPDCLAKCRMTVKPFIPVSGIEVEPDQLTLNDGDTGDLAIRVLPKDASRPDYSIAAEDDSVIKIYRDGHYQAKKPGKTKIVATTREGGFTAVCEVDVKPVPATGVQIQPELSINQGETVKPVWSMVPAVATNRNVTWHSTNPGIAQVDTYGNVTGVSLGTARIEIQTEDGGFTASCKVTVEQYVEDLEFKKPPSSMTLGDSGNLTLQWIPENPTKKKIIWSSSAPSVISVDQQGKIRAQATGTAKITAYDRYTGAYAFCSIQVKAGLKKPKLEGKKVKKNYKLSWKAVKRATNYIIYEQKKKNKSYKKIKTLDGKKRSFTVKKPAKGTKFKIRAYYKPDKEYSKYSNEKKVK